MMARANASTVAAAQGFFGLNGINYDAQYLQHPLVNEARQNPANIDNLIRSYLYTEQFPEELESWLLHYINICTTPGIFDSNRRDRPKWFYANSLIWGTLLGRSFVLLSRPVRPPNSLSDPKEFPFSRLPAELRLHIYDYYKENLAWRQKYWTIMTRIFIKALWSGREPEEGARYITGIIVLTAGHTLSIAAPFLRGRGSRWVWWDDEIKDLDHTWGWDEVESAIYGTVSLPRDNTDLYWRKDFHELYINGQARLNQLNRRWGREMPEYVSKYVLEVMDLAREHLRTDERDWTPPEMEAKFLNNLFNDGEARDIWVATGLVPEVLAYYVHAEDGDHGQ